MHLFMYTGIIITIVFASILVHYQSKKFSKKASWPTERMFKYVLLDMVLCIFVMCFTIFALPRLIWTIGYKEVGEAVVVRETDEIKKYDIDGKSFYIEEISSNGKTLYSVAVRKNKVTEISTFDGSKVEILVDKKYATSRYELVSIYKIEKLKNPSIVNKAVNDIFANIYLQRNKGTFDREKVLIYIPENLVKR